MGYDTAVTTDTNFSSFGVKCILISEKKCFIHRICYAWRNPQADCIIRSISCWVCFLISELSHGLDNPLTNRCSTLCRVLCGCILEVMPGISDVTACGWTIFPSRAKYSSNKAPFENSADQSDICSAHLWNISSGHLEKTQNQLMHEYW